MASVARSAANRLNAQEDTEPLTAAGRIPRKSHIGIADPIYRLKSVGAIVRKANSMPPGPISAENSVAPIVGIADHRGNARAAQVSRATNEQGRGRARLGSVSGPETARTG